MLARRGLLLGLLAAPAVIRTPGLLMTVKPEKHVWSPWFNVPPPTIYPEDGYVPGQLLTWNGIAWSPPDGTRAAHRVRLA